MKHRLAIVLFMVLFPMTACAAERYYMVIFGIQDRLNRFNTAHTFGVFVRAVEEGDDPERFPLTVKIISWLPATDKVHLCRPAEAGRNHFLEESLSVPAADGRSITQWGPVEIEKELFERACRRADDLDHNRLLYKASDERLRKKGVATNCEHAVADIDTDDGFLRTGTGHGNRGSRLVANHLRRWAVGPVERDDLGWLGCRLGLTNFPIRMGKW